MDLFTVKLTLIKGVGARKIEELQSLGIHTVGELLEYFPFRYEDYRVKDLVEATDGEKVTVVGKLYGQPMLQMYGRRKSRMTCKAIVNEMLITLTWFNQAYLRDKLVAGEEMLLTGKWDRRRLQLTVSECEFQGSQTASKQGTLQPVYSVTAGMNQKWLRKVIAQALEQFGSQVEECLPQMLLEKYELMSREQALAIIHQPDDAALGKLARKRMIYEELFLFQLKLQAFRAFQQSRTQGTAHALNLPDIRQFVRSLPFVLTASQKQVIADLLADLQQPICMNRLLQGDVGSGKTVVAAVAMFAVVKAGKQAALMVPTEILAEQHKRTLEQWYESNGITVELLTGSMTERRKREVLAALHMGLIDIVVGTHALIQDGVFFHDLALVVTDEQHRFGVNQRSILRHKGINPDILTMTATPIPRTLAITAFADMDVSSLKEMPKGRKLIKTYAVPHDKLERVLAFIRKEITQGRQAYVICPLIEESEKLDVQNVIDVHQQLAHTFPDLKVGLLHGRLPAAEKDELMRQYSEGHIHILVSTTVVEVGVNVPNATLMVIIDAERFGLSQLHQLRGRVGRGEHQSYCILLADPKSENGRERMKVMTETNDGFEIARRDLELRGPGEFFGTRQSGLPEFRIADLMADFEVMEQARDDAAQLVAQSSFWTGVEFGPLRSYLQREQVITGDMLD